VGQSGFETGQAGPGGVAEKEHEHPPALFEVAVDFLQQLRLERRARASDNEQIAICRHFARTREVELVEMHVVFQEDSSESGITPCAVVALGIVFIVSDKKVGFKGT